MWWAIAWFEIRYHLKQPLFYFTGAALFLLALLSSSTSLGLAFANAPSSVLRNAPAVIVDNLVMLSVFGLFIVTAFVSSSVLRDFENGTHMLFFTKPVTKYNYLGGRFTGSMVVATLQILIGTMGLIVGWFMPWVSAENIGPLSPMPFLFGLGAIAIPNLVVLGAMFFAIAAWARRPLFTYIFVIVFLVLQDYAETIGGTLDNRTLAALIEPIGIVAMNHVTRYWTVTEYNTILPSFTDLLLLNRVVWLGIGALSFLACVTFFDYSRIITRRSRKKRIAPVKPPDQAAARPSFSLPRVVRQFGWLTELRQLGRLTRLDCAITLRSTPFVILLVLCLALVVSLTFFVGEDRGTPIHPVTHLMLEAILAAIIIFLPMVVIFYAGELIWRERGQKLAGINDVLPAPNWIHLGSKLLTLVAIIAVFVGSAVLTTIVAQACRGHFDFELMIYLKGVAIISIFCFLISIPALFFQVISKNKMVGLLIMFLVMIVGITLPRLGYDHILFRYPGRPSIAYSDMNGFGLLVNCYLWSKLYWGFAALALLVLSSLFWVRGVETSLGDRLALARERFGKPARAVIIVALVGFVSTGAYIFYNTNILNQYLSRNQEEAWQVKYEKRYHRYHELPQLRITDVYADVDIYPHQRRVEISGTYQLRNKTDQPISAVHLMINPDITVSRFDFGGQSEELADPKFGYYIYNLPEPVLPGNQIEFAFDLTSENRGFVNGAPDYLVVRNGTFFEGSDFFPHIGYLAALEIDKPSRRRKYDLPERPRVASRDDMVARGNTYVASDADWINFETIVSTCAGQTALAPGYLQREWQENDRHYFHYKMDAPILNFFSYLSAEYTVQRDQWNDVAIDIFYHSPHTYNIDSMIDAIKKSLDYYTANFSPYQYKQVRIVEFPAYRAFAQSFPTMIPFSEIAGFITKPGDRDDIDYCYVRTAHEVAHQWWAHQVIGANVEGMTLMSESLAEYSSLMVLKHKFGEDKMHKYLKYELDAYLSGRSAEEVGEPPLCRVTDQRYIHYNKGALMMYALQDYIGEENVNRALASYIDQVGYQEPPYTTSRDFIACLHEVTPDSLAYIIEDIFETITLFANKAASAEASQLPDGRYLVNLELQAEKYRADEMGAETSVALGDLIDVGIFGQERVNGKRERTVLYMKKHKITEPITKLELIVDSVPSRAGIDPYNKLIDRDSNDNSRKVEIITHGR